MIFKEHLKYETNIYSTNFNKCFKYKTPIRNVHEEQKNEKLLALRTD